MHINLDKGLVICQTSIYVDAFVQYLRDIIQYHAGGILNINLVPRKPAQILLPHIFLVHLAELVQANRLEPRREHLVVMISLMRGSSFPQY